MPEVAQDLLQQIFTEARTFSTWLPKGVDDQTLRSVYDLAKWGPTSANITPMRIVFVKNGPMKKTLLAGVAEFNQEKVKTAPVTAIVAFDEHFYDQIPKLFPNAPQYREVFASNPTLSATSAFRNGSLQGGYFILAARALGLDCGPMSGFDNHKIDESFFAGTSWKSNFICNLGYGDRSGLHPRNPRLTFDEACKIV